MATIDTAAAWRAKVSLPLVLAAAFTSLSLAGCETTSNLLASATSATTSNEIPQAKLASEPAPQQKPLIAIAPVIGAPEPVAEQFKSSLASALQTKGINAATSTAVATAYTLRGYVVSAREGSGTKVSYIWDVTTPSGQRVHRVTGEELVASAPASRDPWQAVSPQIVSSIVGKTSTELANWLPSQASAQPAMADANPTPVASAAKAAPQSVASTSAPSSGPTTGSIRTAAAPASAGEAVALVPSVTGAPGDGSVSLANAIRKELERKGVRMASVPTPGAYRVLGKVQLGPKSGDTQPISIDWEVKDATGNSVGTVSQKNDIPAGSLDGAWGQTADAAAAAAAHGIAELMSPTKTASR